MKTKKAGKTICAQNVENCPVECGLYFLLSPGVAKLNLKITVHFMGLIFNLRSLMRSPCSVLNFLTPHKIYPSSQVEINEH